MQQRDTADISTGNFFLLKSDDYARRFCPDGQRRWRNRKRPATSRRRFLMSVRVERRGKSSPAQRRRLRPVNPIRSNTDRSGLLGPYSDGWRERGSNPAPRQMTAFNDRTRLTVPLTPELFGNDLFLHSSLFVSIVSAPHILS